MERLRWADCGSFLLLPYYKVRMIASSGSCAKEEEPPARSSLVKVGGRLPRRRMHHAKRLRVASPVGC